MLKLDKYEFAFEISPIPMLLVSKDGKIVLTNKLFDQLFGYEPMSLIGKNVDILVAESMRAHHPDLRRAYFKTPAKRNMGRGRDLDGIMKSGKVIPLELGLDTVTVDGESYALVVALDIQQRKQHEQRMNLAMDAAASAMIMVNDAGKIVFVNKAALILFGYEEDDLLNSHIERLVPKPVQSVHPVYRGSFFSVGKARSMASDIDLFALHNEGHEFPVEIALTPVETPEGRMVVSTIVDLSERVSAQKSIAKKSAELEQLNDDLMQFAYSASHDLKAPLSTMVGLLDICIDDWDDGNLDLVRDNIMQVLQIGRRCSKKVENVLEIAMVRQTTISSEAADLETMIRNIWLDLAGANQDKIQLHINLNHENPIVLEVNTLNVILENLVSNAIRYCDQKKTEKYIEITSRCENNKLIISVADNGIGIPAKGRDTVFKMFSRIDERSENGLGLTLVKKHIDRLSGTISFESTAGEGTKFTVSLPLMS